MKTEEDKSGAGDDPPDYATISIGHFEFLNGYPLYYGLEKGEGWGCFNLVHGVPTRLNRLLLDGELDISPISSIEYAGNDDKLLLFPRLSITADGAVGSDGEPGKKQQFVVVARVLDRGDGADVQFPVEQQPIEPGRNPMDQVETAPCLLYTSPSPRDRTRSRM